MNRDVVIKLSSNACESEVKYYYGEYSLLLGLREDVVIVDYNLCSYHTEDLKNAGLPTPCPFLDFSIALRDDIWKDLRPYRYKLVLVESSNNKSSVLEIHISDISIDDAMTLKLSW